MGLLFFGFGKKKKNNKLTEIADEQPPDWDEKIDVITTGITEIGNIFDQNFLNTIWQALNDYKRLCTEWKRSSSLCDLLDLIIKLHGEDSCRVQSLILIMRNTKKQPKGDLERIWKKVHNNNKLDVSVQTIKKNIAEGLANTTQEQGRWNLVVSWFELYKLSRLKPKGSGFCRAWDTAKTSPGGIPSAAERLAKSLWESKKNFRGMLGFVQKEVRKLPKTIFQKTSSEYSQTKSATKKAPPEATKSLSESNKKISAKDTIRTLHPPPQNLPGYNDSLN